MNVFKQYDSKQSPKQIEVLRIIDPTLIEDKEHILVSVIASIKRRVDAAYKDGNAGRDEEYNRWLDRLKRLARGLRLLNSIGSDKLYGEEWNDEHWALEQGLKNARMGADLEVDLHAFIRDSLSFLNRNSRAFLLAFDDIDTSFDRGWPVLEIIRKYLTTPQLIVLLSGDFQLYASLVRRQQFIHLGQYLLENDRPSRKYNPDEDLKRWERDHYVNLVNKLEDQYLLKVLQPENRINMLTLAEYQRLPQYGLRVGKPGQSETLREVLHSRLQAGLFLNGTESLSVFESAILQQPVRTAIDILRATQASQDTTLSGSALLPDILTDIASSALLHRDIQAELVKASSVTLLQSIRAWLTRADVWDEGYRLLPNYHDNEDNLVVLALGSQLAHRIHRSPEIAMLQILTIGLIRELILLPWPKGAGPTSPNQMFNFLMFHLNERPITIARRLVNAFRSQLTGENYRQPFYGTIPVRGEGLRINLVLQRLYRFDTREDLDNAIKRAKSGVEPEEPPRLIKSWFDRVVVEHYKPGRFRGVAYNTISSLADLCRSMRLFVNLPASNMPDDGGRERTYFSIFGLLGAVTDLMTLPSAEEVANTLVRLGEIRTYPLPPWRAGSADLQIEYPDDLSDTFAGQDDARSTSDDFTGSITALPMTKALEAWVEEVIAIRTGDPTAPRPVWRSYHPHVYARMTTRFYYMLTRIDEELTQADWYTGYLLHRQIIALLNAIFIEERIATEGIARARLYRNATTSDTEFYLNLKAPDANSDPASNDVALFDQADLPFFRLVASCPLWAMYVRPKSQIRLGDTRPLIATWDLLDALKNIWPGRSKDTEAVYAEATKVKLTFASDQEPITFENLFEPLNSISVLGGASGTNKGNATSQGTVRRGRPPKA